MRDQLSDGGVVLENAINHWVHRVYQATRNDAFRAFREAAGEEVTPEQWIVLVRLWEQDGRTQTELGEATYRDRPTMCRLLVGLEKRGLIERHSHECSPRKLRVFLTPRAKALQKPLVAVARALVRRALKGIPAQDLETTRSTLERIFTNVTGAAPERAGLRRSQVG